MVNLDLKSLLSFYSKQSVDCSFVEVILRSIPAGVIFVEKENQKIVYVNDRFVQITGYNPMGLSFKHYALEVAKTRMMDRGPYAFDQLPLTKALLYGKAVYDQELIIYRQDNSEVAIISNAAPILDDKGQVMGAFSILSDNSECKKAADALKRSEENYRHLLRYAPAAIFQIYYQTPSFLSVNDAMTTLTGYDKEELLSLNPYTLLEPESVERLKDRIRRGLAGENIEGPVEYKVITKDGRHLWTILYVKPFYREGKLNNALVVAYDITERKNSEEALKKSEAKLRIQERTLSLIYNNVSEILYSLAIEPNNTYRFTSVNQPFLDATGLKENEIVGKTVNEVIPEPSLSLVLEKYNQAIKEKQTIRWDETTVYPAGEKIGEVTVAPIFDSEDRPLYIIGNVHDITERKKSEQKLEEYKNHLEQLVEERTRQLKEKERLATIGETAGMVGHDIRNPLQAMINDVYLLKDELTAMPESKTKAGVVESLGSVEKNIVYVNKIVADLQDYARPIMPEYSTVRLHRLVTKILENISVPLDIQVNVDIEKTLKVETDATLLNRVLYNLVTNAIQAMPKGGKLTLSGCASDDTVLIFVEDTGVGIPDEIKPKLFKPLVTFKSQGQGFGLAVAKRFVELMQGSIDFESWEGKGTKFKIVFPLVRKKGTLPL